MRAVLCRRARRFDSGGAAAAPTALTGASAGGGRSDRRVTLALIKDEGIGMGAPAYVQVRSRMCGGRPVNASCCVCFLCHYRIAVTVPHTIADWRLVTDTPDGGMLAMMGPSTRGPGFWCITVALHLPSGDELMPNLARRWRAGSAW